MTALDEKILLLEQDLLRKDLRLDRALLETLIADDFVEFGASGTVYDRTAIIEALIVEREPPNCAISQFTARLISNRIALAAYRAGAFRRSSIWRREDEGWRIVFHQASPAPENEK